MALQASPDRFGAFLWALAGAQRRFLGPEHMGMARAIQR